MKNAVRLFIVPWYLLGWILHVYLATTNPGLYQNFGSTALIPALKTIWQAWIMPNIVAFTLVLAAFELLVGFMLAGKGRPVKYGLVASILFNMFLVVLGLSGQATDWISDFLMNRLPNLFFIAIQIPLLFSTFDQPLSEVFASYFRRFAQE